MSFGKLGTSGTPFPLQSTGRRRPFDTSCDGEVVKGAALGGVKVGRLAVQSPEYVPRHGVSSVTWPTKEFKSMQMQVEK